MKRAVVFVLILMAVLNFSITINQIREISKRDPDEAFTLLARYIKDHPGDKRAEELGKIISAKRKLAEIPEIKDAAIKEDVYALIDSMASLNAISKEMMGYVETIFPNFYNALREKVMKFDEKAFKVCYMLPERVREPKGFEKVVVDTYFKDPLHFDPRVIYKLRCMNLPRLKRKIKNYLESLMKEENYVKIITIADMLMISLPNSTDLHLYANVVYKINSKDAVYMDEEDFKSIVEDYEKIKLDKKLLGEKLKSLYMKLVQRIDVSCDDEKICPPVEKVSEITVPSTQSTTEEAPLLSGSGLKESTGIFQSSTAEKVLNEGGEKVSEKEGKNWLEENINILKLVVTAIGLALAALVFTLTIIKIRDPKRKIKKVLKKIERDPTNPELHMRLAELYEEIGRVEEAVKEYKLASKLFSYEKEPSENNRS